jgi:hypothetical protein
MNRRRNKQRTTSKSTEAADWQIQALHQAMADKLLAEPERLADIKLKLEQRYQAGQLRHSGYIHWHSVLDTIDEPQLFRQELLSNDARMRKLRRRTILVGVLTEAERQQVLSTLAALVV